MYVVHGSAKRWIVCGSADFIIGRSIAFSKHIFVFGAHFSAAASLKGAHGWLHSLVGNVHFKRNGRYIASFAKQSFRSA